MTKPLRLDADLVRRGLAASRSEAKRVIEQGGVLVGGMPVTRPAAMVTAGAVVTLAGPGRAFVSRGGDKLDGALERLGIEVEGRRWLDAGASTGGFSDRLLEGAAAQVIAVDVGYGQLDWRIRNDPRVIVLERLNARALRVDHVGELVDGVVADLSFISLRLVLPALVSVAVREADFLLLVKPQFEVGREDVPRGGVVRDPRLWARALALVVKDAGAFGLGLCDAVVARPPGPAGNREFFVHLRCGCEGSAEALERAVESAQA